MRENISKLLAYETKGKKTKFIMSFIDNKNKNLYSEIKKACLQELGIPSQVVLKDTIYDKRDNY